MKNIKALLLTLFIIQLGFSQTEQAVRGKVRSSDSPVEGVVVINFTTKESTITDNEGVFTIKAKSNDDLLFFHKSYADRKFTVTPKHSDNLDIELILNTNGLQEVVIKNNYLPHVTTSPGEWEMMQLQALQDRPKPPVYDGTMPYGMNFLAIGFGAYELARQLFAKNDVRKKPVRKIAFRDYIAANLKEDYFINELKLNPKEIPRFITYCTFDPKSNIISNDGNILTVMDFMEEKCAEFKKL